MFILFYAWLADQTGDAQDKKIYIKTRKKEKKEKGKRKEKLN